MDGAGKQAAQLPELIFRQAPSGQRLRSKPEPELSAGPGNCARSWCGIHTSADARWRSCGRHRMRRSRYGPGATAAVLHAGYTRPSLSRIRARVRSSPRSAHVILTAGSPSPEREDQARQALWMTVRLEFGQHHVPHTLWRGGGRGRRTRSLPRRSGERLTGREGDDVELPASAAGGARRRQIRPAVLD